MRLPLEFAHVTVFFGGNVAGGLELDWVVIRVQPLRTVLAVLAVGSVAVALVFFAYKSLNLSPEARAHRAIESAAAAFAETEAKPLPAQWRGELLRAAEQLEQARAAYVEGNWEEAESLANDTLRRFNALAGASGQEVIGAGQFFSIIGRVEVQRAGQTLWESAHHKQPVFNGDFVRTGRDGNAEILFADGSLYRISPDSLLEIHNQLSQESPGTVKMVVGRINVFTSGTPSTVTTDSVETEIERDSRVAVDVAGDGQETTVAAFQGSATVRNIRGDEVVVNEREAIEASPQGTLSEKREIPAVPQLVAPQNNVGFDVGKRQVIELIWQGRPAGGTVHLQVSRSKSFEAGQLEVDATALAKDSARLRLVAAGSYFWRAANRRGSAPASEWSSVRRFRVFSTTNENIVDDTTPPDLFVSPPQQLGNMFIVEGATEVTATIKVNGEPVELSADGRFRKTAEIYKEGWNEIVVVATDPSGNQREKRERVFVEVF